MQAVSTGHDRRTLRIALANWRDSGHPEAGGAEVFLEQVSAELAALGHRVTVCTARYPGSAADETRGGVRFVRRGGRFGVYPATLAWLARHRREFDVVADVQNGLPFWTPLLRVPVVNVTHHVHEEQWPEVFGPVLSRIGWWLEASLAPRVYRRCEYFTVSRATRAELAGVGVDDARVTIGYSGLHDGGVPFDLGDGPRTPAPSLVVLGRLVPHKRVELAVDAVAALRERHPGLTLSVVGGGYWAPQLHAYAQARGVADAVRFTGTVDEATKRRLLATSWVNLLPSLKEGWGLVVVEAGIHATPTVAFRSAGGTTESVRDGVTGVLVDTPAEFVATVGRLLDDRAATRRMGRAAREHAGAFTWAATAGALEAVLRRAASGERAEVGADGADRPGGGAVLAFQQRRAEQGDVERRGRRVRVQAQQDAFDQAAVGDR